MFGVFVSIKIWGHNIAPVCNTIWCMYRHTANQQSYVRAIFQQSLSLGYLNSFHKGIDNDFLILSSLSPTKCSAGLYRVYNSTWHLKLCHLKLSLTTVHK